MLTPTRNLMRPNTPLAARATALPLSAGRMLAATGLVTTLTLSTFALPAGAATAAAAPEPSRTTAAAVTPTAATPGSASASPLAVKCGRFTVKTRYAKANGTLCRTNAAISVQGKITDYRKAKSKSNLYLRYRSLGKDYKHIVQGVGNGQTRSFNRTYRVAAPGSITLNVCSYAGGKWHCGVKQRY